MTTVRESPFDDRSSDDAEMWCDRCERRHGVVWFAPSDLWNATMREGDRGNPDEFGFCCPICFMQLAEERGVVPNAIWRVAPEGNFDARSGWEHGLTVDAAEIWHEPQFNQIVITTPGSTAASLNAAQAREAASALLAFADLWERVAGEGE